MRDEHVLVVRPGALGDALLTVPVLGALYDAGAASVAVLGTPASWAFLPASADAPRILSFASNEWLGLFADGAHISDDARGILTRTSMAIIYLREGADVFQRRLAELGVKKILTAAPPVEEIARSEVQDDRTALRSVNSLTPPRVSAHHAVRCLLDPLAPLLPDNAVGRAFDSAHSTQTRWFSPSKDEAETAREFLEAPLRGFDGFFALHPGSGGRRKCWPAARFAELALRLTCEMNLLPLVFFGPADAVARAEFEDALPAGTPWHAAAQRPLREVLALLHLSRFFVGNDSGIAHLAGRATHVLAIFGPTDPDRWAPLGKSVRTLRAPDGKLDALSVEDVLIAARQFQE